MPEQRSTLTQIATIYRIQNILDKLPHPHFGKREGTLAAIGLLSVSLASCGSENAQSQSPETVTVTSAPETDYPSSPLETEPETTSSAPTSTESSSPETRVIEKYEAATMPETLMPAVHTFEIYSYEENDPRLAPLYDLYPQLQEKMGNQKLAFQQNATVDSINEAQSALDTVMNAEILTVDENGVPNDELVPIQTLPELRGLYENGDLGSLGAQDKSQKTELQLTIEDPNVDGSSILAGSIVLAGETLPGLKAIATQQTAVNEYFTPSKMEGESDEQYNERIAPNLTEYATRVENEEPTQSTITPLEFLRPNYIIDPDDDTNERNMDDWVNKALYAPDTIGNDVYNSYPVQFLNETLTSQQGVKTEIYGITILSEANQYTRLDTFVIYPENSGYFTSVYDEISDDFTAEKVNKPWFNFAKVASSTDF